jgi:hypothetical protein
MKKLFGLTGIIALFILSGCLDTSDETTLNEDGSGVVVSSLDMSKMLSLLSTMGAGDEKLKEVEKLKIDTVIFFKDMKDSIGKLSDSEKKLLEKGTAHLKIDYEEEKFLVAFSVPFIEPSDIIAVNDVLKKTKGKVMERIMSKVMPENEKNGDNEDMGDAGDRDGTPDLSNYYDYTYEKNKMTKKVNNERLANVEDDKSLKSLQEMSQMGMPVNFKTIINLPRAAKKAQGKGVTLSDDRKTITIEGTLDDFFEDASKFEYEIEF